MIHVTITPDTVAAILKKASPLYAEGHDLNSHHHPVRQCKLGAVFVDQAGDYCVYTGIDGRNLKFPVMSTRVHDRQARKHQIVVLNKITEASK